MNNPNKGYFTKDNSTMCVFIAPTTGATPTDNLNAIFRVIELSGGMILEPCSHMESNIYHTIARAEETAKRSNPRNPRHRSKQFYDR